jgi:glycosyltransferase involved in cell wall biosynthesis
MTPTLSVIIPTVGRPALMRILEDLQPDLGDHDEVLVVGDGDYPQAALIVSAMGDERFAYYPGPVTACYGNAQRQYGMTLARGSHLCFFDDDDRVLTGGLRILRVLAGRYPSHLTLTRMIDKHGLLLWAEPELKQGNVSTQMILVPNIPSCLGTWGARYEGDYDFIASTVARGWPIHWSTTILADCRPCLNPSLPPASPATASSIAPT